MMTVMKQSLKTKSNRPNKFTHQRNTLVLLEIFFDKKGNSNKVSPQSRLSMDNLKKSNFKDPMPKK